MNKAITLICALFILSSSAFADETYANGAGTIITGLISGHKYCKSNTKMNWWNAYIWCEGINL